MKTCSPIYIRCLICKDREATVYVHLTDPIEINIPACAFCAGFPEEELVARVLRKEKE